MQPQQSTHDFRQIWMRETFSGIDCLEELRINIFLHLQTRPTGCTGKHFIDFGVRVKRHAKLRFSVFKRFIRFVSAEKKWLCGEYRKCQSATLMRTRRTPTIGCGSRCANRPRRLDSNIFRKYKLTYEWVCYWIEFTTDNMLEWLKSQEHLYRIESQ